MFKLQAEIDETQLRVLVKEFFEQQGIGLEDKDIEIQVKSRQNYKSEWEQAAFRAVVTQIKT